MKKVVIYSDGACQGNPGPGGWGVLLLYGSTSKELSGGVTATTNNRMELQAAIEGLGALREPCEVEVFTDSEYLRQGVTKWIWGWKKNGWLTKAKKPVKNADLWRRLDENLRSHQVTWRWLKGHAGHEGNERCDGLATRAIEKLRAAHTQAQLKEDLEAFVASQDVSHPQLAGLR